MRLFALLSLIALPALAAAVDLDPPGIADGVDMAGPALAPFVATYDVKRADKVIGEATMRLSKVDAQVWSLVTETRGTAGMARLLGLDVREASTFRIVDGRLTSLDYRYRQDATIKSKERSIDFDWTAGEARVVDKKELFRYALAPGAIDRHLVAIALSMQRPPATGELTLLVASKDALETQRFRHAGESTMAAPDARDSGSSQATRPVTALRLERIDKPGKGSSWYAAGTLPPLMIEQTQKDGAAIVMTLRNLH